MSRVRTAVLLGSMLIASVSLAAGVPAARAAAPAGYAPGSPAGSEYQEQLTTAREIGAREGERPGDDPASEGGAAPTSGQRSVPAPLFGAGITAGGGSDRGRARPAPRDVGTPSGDSVTRRAPAGQRAAIATAARAPLDGPSSSLLTGLLVVAALLTIALLALLLRRDGTRPSS